jgi:hypothetical protein
MIVLTFVVHNGRPSYIDVGFKIWVFVKQIRVYSYYVYIFFYLNSQWLKIDCRYFFVSAACILLALSNIKCNMNFHLIKQIGYCYDESMLASNLL